MLSTFFVIVKPKLWRPKNSYNFTKDDTKDDTKELTEQQRLILSLIAQDGTITRGDLAQKIGVSDSTVARELQALVANGYLVRVGGRKQGVWKVL